MLRRYVVSAEYLRFLEAQLMMAIHDTRFDQHYRQEGEETRARWSKVPAELYDPSKIGETAIVEIGVADVIEFDETNPASSIAANEAPARPGQKLARALRAV